MAETIALAPQPNTDWRAVLKFGYIVLFLVFVVFGGWAAFASIDSAVQANGVVTVESNRKTIQHLEGGIVREILVRDGDRVEEGQVLIRLDPTRIEAIANAAAKGLAGALAVEARLNAQRDMLDQVTFPPEISQLLDSVSGTTQIEDNRRQFESRRAVLARALDVLESQAKQVGNEIAQAKLDRKSAEDQNVTVIKELESVRPLLAKGLVQLSRVTMLERQKLQYEGAIDRSKNDIVKGEDRIAEINLRIAGLKQDYQQEAANQLIDIGKQIAEFRQQREVAFDLLKRTEIRSPVAGTVQQLKVFTVGGVVRPGDPILDVVPDSSELVVRAKVYPGDIDRLSVGMHAEIKLVSLMRYRREKISGELRFVSRDLTTDPNPNPNVPPYYTIEATFTHDSIPEDIRDKLQAGMDAVVVVPTRGRTVLQYLLAPVIDNFESSLRER